MRLLTTMIPPHNSLVKYDNPILVSTTGKKGKKGAKDASAGESKQPTQTRDILNSILPPRCARRSPAPYLAPIAHSVARRPR